MDNPPVGGVAPRSPSPGTKSFPKSFPKDLDGRPSPPKRPKLEEDHRPHSGQQARTSSEGYITPGSTSEGLNLATSTSSVSSGTNSISSASSGSGVERKDSNGDEGEETPPQDPSSNPGTDRPNREFLRQEPARVNRAHSHSHARQHYPVTAIPFPASQPVAPIDVPQAMAPVIPARFVPIERTQLPIATVAVPIPASNMPTLPQLHPMIHPPLTSQQLASFSNQMAANTNGTAPMSPAVSQTQLPPPQQIMSGFDPAYTLAFHYHFYPPGVSFYPVGVPTGVPGIVFPGTLNHGLYQTPQTASSAHQSNHSLRSNAETGSSSDLTLASSASSGSSASSASSAGSMGSLSAITNPIPMVGTPVPYGMYPVPDGNKSKLNVVSSSKRQYCCPYDGCEWSFTRASDQRRHIKSHEKPLLQCPFWTPHKSCHRNSGAFNRLDVLKRHLRLVHFEPMEDSLQKGSTAGRCRHCRVDFATIKDFVNHCNACAAHFYGSSSSSGGSSSGSGGDSNGSDDAEFND